MVGGCVGGDRGTKGRDMAVTHTLSGTRHGERSCHIPAPSPSCPACPPGPLTA